MMVKNIRLWILALLCVWTIAAMAQTDAESAKSVVKIKTVVLATEGGKEVKKLGTASGWCWKEPTLVVTALHAVAGVSTIDVYVNGSESCTATVERVLKEADLALLRLSKDLGLKPLTVDNVEPNSNKEYYVWGFPHAVYTIQGDEIRFSRSLEAAPTLNSILTGNKLKFELRQQGYPLPEARILRIGSTIQPGHSGAPIFTSDGKVIGIADGGLRGGTARINWAMPAGLYVSKLFTSTDAYPTAASMQVTLYNSSTTVDADATESEENQQIVAVAKQESVVNGSVAVHQTWTTDFDQIYDNADEDEQVEIDSFLEQLGLDLTDTEYDIYEDYKSGATFALPKGAQMKVENGWYYAHNKSATIHYYILPFDAKTFANAQVNAQRTFDDFLKREAYYIPEGQKPDEIEVDAENETASYDKTRFADNGTKLLSYMAKIEGPYLLVTVFQIDLTQLDKPGALHELGHFGMAGEVSDFVKY